MEDNRRVSRRSILLVLLVLAAVAYGWLDARNRARIDRGPRFHRTDFTVYQSAAHALKHGTDPFEARNPRGYRYVYPPLLAIALMPVADWEPQNAAYLFFLISMAALVGSLVLLRRVPFGGAPLGWRPVLIAIGLCVGFAHQGFQRGQVTHLLLAIQVGALALCLGRRYALAGLVLAVGIAIRLTPLLPAGAVGIGLLAASRRMGPAPVLRYAGGLAGGLLLTFVLIPTLALGVDRANEVNGRWVDVTYDVYVADAPPDQLLADYKINEFRFKNQSPRRVFATWAGWAKKTDFEKERPLLSERGWSAVNLGGRAIGLAVLIAIAMLAWVRMDAPQMSQFVATYALAVFAPVLVTRYTWPTHYLMAVPLLAVIAWLALRGARPARRALAYFLGGTALFYIAHAKPLEPMGAAGPLLVAATVIVVMATRALFRRPA